MSRWRLIGLITLIALVAGWFVTRPAPLPVDALDGLTGDPIKGQMTFAAAGCASCHVSEDGPPEVLSGGKAFQSDFGTFFAPNISPDPVHGIGGWSDLELASAIMQGVSRDGSHLYPAFPYTSYSKANLQDVVDLIAYLRTLPVSDQTNTPHDLGFPFNQRITLGAWKLLFFNDDWVLPAPATPAIERGRYLTESLGHCAECHTPRNALGGSDQSRWMAGAPHPSGEGRIPNITSAELTWSESEIASYLKSGFTPEFDSAGGEMAAVIKNTSQLSDEDRAAIAAYLKAIPPVAN